MPIIIMIVRYMSLSVPLFLPLLLLLLLNWIRRVSESVKSNAIDRRHIRVCRWRMAWVLVYVAHIQFAAAPRYRANTVSTRSNGNVLKVNLNTPSCWQWKWSFFRTIFFETVAMLTSVTKSTDRYNRVARKQINSSNSDICCGQLLQRNWNNKLWNPFRSSRTSS